MRETRTFAEDPDQVGDELRAQVAKVRKLAQDARALLENASESRVPDSLGSDLQANGAPSSP